MPRLTKKQLQLKKSQLNVKKDKMPTKNTAKFFEAEVNYSLAEFSYNEDFVLDLMEAQDENPVIQGEDFDFLDNEDVQDWIEIDGICDIEESQLDVASALK
ncbi:hypothetical protein EDC96DRAFT_549008 [Choanephora cucurbitarum]|nr:hypothetical protein EDC96DRAFT_549008 [Choanephora cucurbitarum]